MTKNDMARVIVAALYNMDRLPAPDHHAVKGWERKRKAELADHHKRAVAAIESVRAVRDSVEPTEVQQGLIPIPDAYAEQ